MNTPAPLLALAVFLAMSGSAASQNTLFGTGEKRPEPEVGQTPAIPMPGIGYSDLIADGWTERGDMGRGFLLLGKDTQRALCSLDISNRILESVEPTTFDSLCLRITEPDG